MYKQLCVIHGILVPKKEIKDFEKQIKDFTGCRIKYETQVETLPDLDDRGKPVKDTGGRIDVFFYIHDEDVMNFAVTRLQLGVRWWEDVIKYNDNRHLYTKEFIDQYPCTW